MAKCEGPEFALPRPSGRTHYSDRQREDDRARDHGQRRKHLAHYAERVAITLRGKHESTSRSSRDARVSVGLVFRYACAMLALR